MRSKLIDLKCLIMISNGRNPSSISSIIVEELFGKFSYVIPLDKQQNIDFSKLLIFYGLNGSGKTTLLHMIFHLISPEGKKRHRSYISDIMFKKLAIMFVDGREVSIERQECSKGEFLMYIKNKNKIINKYDFKQFREAKEKKKYNQFIENLKDLKINSYFLTDDRDFLSDFIEEEYEKRYLSSSRFIHSFDDDDTYIVRERIRNRRISRKDLLIDLLNDAVERVENWVRHKVRRDSRKGEFSLNRIYFTILNKLVKSEKEEDLKQEEWNNLIRDLGELERIIPRYSSLRLLTPIKIKGLRDIIESASEERRKSIHTLLKPYIDGLKAKINALEKILGLTEKFVKNINFFFHNKTLEFDYLSGIQIKSDSSKLKLNLLSSGEKQLLLLFCNILPARDKTSIFIIDEPEISLNVEWQRELIRALLELTEESNIQFIFATHSIELTTQYEENVVDLININKF